MEQRGRTAAPRPKKPARGSKRVFFRCPKPLLNRVDAYLVKTEITVSKFCRTAIDDYLTRNG